MLKEGDRAPEFSLPAVDHPPVSLQETLAGGYHALLVFLRHLG